MLFGALFLGLALFLAPALFGRPPQSQVWDRLVVGLLPPDVDRAAAPPVRDRRRRAERPAVPRSRPTSTDPEQAEREQKKLPRRALGDELRAGPGAGQGREQADPDRLHRRQLRQLPADGERRLAPARGRRRCSRSSSRSSSTPTSSRSPRSRPTSARSWPSRTRSGSSTWRARRPTRSTSSSRPTARSSDDRRLPRARGLRRLPEQGPREGGPGERDEGRPGRLRFRNRHSAIGWGPVAVGCRDRIVRLQLLG